MSQKMKTEPKKSSRGRPRKAPVQGERHPVTVRLTAETKRDLEEAADSSGRSLSQEIEVRLEHSFSIDRMLGGGDTAMLLRALAGVVWIVEQHYGQKWNTNDITAAAVKAAIDHSVFTALKTIPIDEIGQLAFRDVLDHPEPVEPQIAQLVKEREKEIEHAREVGRSYALGASTREPRDGA
jgi:uncharacterized protein (DUF1778 family)